MQFQISGAAVEAPAIAAALRLLDPDAVVALDRDHGHLDIQSVASGRDVADALQRLGLKATPLAHEVHVSGGSTCCGGCS